MGGEVRGFLVLSLNEIRLSTRGLRHWRQFLNERKRVEGNFAVYKAAPYVEKARRSKCAKGEGSSK